MAKKKNKKVIKKSKPKKVSKKTSKKAKASHKVKPQIVTEEKLADLVRRGKSRGFITESEIIQTFPNIEQDISGLEHLYSHLESVNIKVVGSQERLSVA